MDLLPRQADNLYPTSRKLRQLRVLPRPQFWPSIIWTVDHLEIPAGLAPEDSGSQAPAPEPCAQPSRHRHELHGWSVVLESNQLWSPVTAGSGYQANDTLIGTGTRTRTSTTQLYEAGLLPVEL